MAVIGAACTPAPTTFNLGPLTAPIPAIGAAATPVNVSVLGICTVGYTPPSFYINGATVSLPSVTLDAAAGTATIPNVTVNIPAVTIGLPAVQFGCFGANVSTQVNVLIPATSQVQTATLNIQTGVLTLSNPSFTITGVGLQFPGLGSLTIPLPNITIPLPNITIPLT